MKKIYRYFLILLISIILFLLYYNILYVFIHTYIFPFRFEDNLDSVVKSMFFSFVIWVFFSITTLFFINKLWKK